MIPLKVAFLWHQHQPLYRSPRNGRYSLPWVRLHGLKDYYDMAALAAEHPRLHLTFNLVPSLLDQLDDYAAGAAIDPALELARRPAADLSEEERFALLDLFFSVPYRTLIAPYPRYAALYHKRGPRGLAIDDSEMLGRFRIDDLRDLQVWFHLAWCGATLRGRKEVRDLFKKGDGFTEDEKAALLEIQETFLREIVPIHRRLRAEGIAEISTSPYYHPILPLLCDLGSAREAIPDLPLPDMPFRRPADAAFQVREAIGAIQRRFDARPSGVWPSEGSLSEQAVRILGECGAGWTASDQELLNASSPGLGGDAHYRPYHLDPAGEAGPAIFFRDHTLSDLIGFTYTTWEAGAAAADFMERLRRIGRQAPGGVVSVILDGENAWEHYPDNGVAFLRALYEGLTKAEEIETVTFSQALETGPSPGRLPSLRAGSWIGASLATWIGHPEKNRAWSLLSSARQQIDRRYAGMGSAHESTPAFKALAAAEGSDWFWWFGEDHSSEQDAIFDASFRDLLRSVYRLLDMPAPDALDEPIKRARGQAWTPPTSPIHPVLDGSVTDYFEWLGAGGCDAAAGQSAMHQTSGLIRRVAFGTDGSSLFVRIDPERGDVKTLLAGLARGSLSVELTAPERLTLIFQLEGDRISHKGSGIAARYAAGDVLEVELGLPSSAPVEFYVGLADSGGPIQRLPRDGVLILSSLDPADWSV